MENEIFKEIENCLRINGKISHCYLQRKCKITGNKAKEMIEKFKLKEKVMGNHARVA